MRATIVILLLLVCASLSALGQDTTAIVLPGPPPQPQAPSREAPATPVLPPLRLEWPAWLKLPGAPLASQRTNPPGRIGRWAEETCPGDVMEKASLGCLKRVYQCSNNLKEVYQYFEGLLYQHGYTTENLNTQPYANLQLGKSIGHVFASLTMREYTTKGKFEPDTSIEGYIHGNSVILTRFVGDNQRYVLTLSAEGNRLDGFGDGWFINHANLNMRRAGAPA